MEEKKPQDFEINTTEAESIAEVTEPIDTESVVPGAETEAPAEEVFVEEDLVAEESVFEEVETEESAGEEPTAKETLEEEETTPEGATSAEEILEEKPVGEGSINEPEPEKPQVEDAPQKRVAEGLVIKPWQLGVAAVVVVAMLVGSVALGVAIGNKKQSTFNDSPVDYEWVLPQGGSTNENQIVLPGYDQLIFPAGEKQIEIVLPNPKGNPCYFRYTLILEETGEILCQTKLIPPGQAVLQIELSHSLTKGEYSLIIKVDSISLTDGHTPMNGGQQKVLLKVE